MVKNSRAASRAGAIRSLNSPRPVIVKAGSNGQPRTISGLEVAATEDLWRIDDEWWRERPISRKYWECGLEDGTKVTVFQDLLTGLWSRQSG